MKKKEKMENNKACECHRTRVRTEDEARGLYNRLSRIEGQIKGLMRMLDESRYCLDILTQVTAVSSALSAFSRELLASHIKGCVVEDIKAGKEETADELIRAVSGFIK